MKRLTECHEKFIVKSNIPVLTSGVVVSLLGHVVVDAELGLGDDEFLLGVREHNSLVIENRLLCCSENNSLSVNVEPRWNSKTLGFSFEDQK